MLPPSFSSKWSRSSQRRRLSFPGGTARPGPALRTEAGRWENKLFCYFFGETKLKRVWRFYCLTSPWHLWAESPSWCSRRPSSGFRRRGTALGTNIYLLKYAFLMAISGTHCHPPVESQPWSRGETQCPLTKRKPLIFKCIPFVRNHRMHTWSDK